MNSREKYDCAIIGGGVAGLSAAILLAQQKRKVILIEKETYPFHKVCGEYISNESISFIEKLGVQIRAQHLPEINSLLLTSPLGISIQRPLSVGGIGISRYLLDEQLYNIALALKVDVRTNTKVQDVIFNEKNDSLEVKFNDTFIQAKTVCGAYGKNSNIDVKLNRKIRVPNKNNLFIGVKYHIKVPYQRNQVELHNFSKGYCGMSAIENDKVNLSYITKVENLENCNNNIQQMEQQILSKNPFLKNYFSKAEFIFDRPLVISHLSFAIKQPVEKHLLMLGDAAGNIAPLSGNGMSMAFRSASIVLDAIQAFLNNQTTRLQMEEQYQTTYQKTFISRIKIAGLINKNFGKKWWTDLNFIGMKLFPQAVDFVSSKIHGEEF